MNIKELVDQLIEAVVVGRTKRDQQVFDPDEACYGANWRSYVPGATAAGMTVKDHEDAAEIHQELANRMRGTDKGKAHQHAALIHRAIISEYGQPCGRVDTNSALHVGGCHFCWSRRQNNH